MSTKNNLKNLDEYTVTSCQYCTGYGVSPDKPRPDEEIYYKVRRGTHLWFKVLSEDEKQLCDERGLDWKYGLINRNGRIMIFLQDGFSLDGIERTKNTGKPAKETAK